MLGVPQAIIIFCVVSSLVSLGVVVLTAWLLHNYYAAQPVRLLQAHDQLRADVKSELATMRLEVADFLEQMASVESKVAKERQATTMERGRIEKARRVEEQTPQAQLIDADQVLARARALGLTRLQ